MIFYSLYLPCVINLKKIVFNINIFADRLDASVKATSRWTLEDIATTFPNFSFNIKIEHSGRDLKYGPHVYFWQVRLHIRKLLLWYLSLTSSDILFKILSSMKYNLWVTGFKFLPPLFMARIWRGHDVPHDPKITGSIHKGMLAN